MTDTFSPQLNIALYEYFKAFNQLVKANQSPSKKQILTILLARDAVEVALKEVSVIPVNSLIKLQDYDSRLKTLEKEKKIISKTISLEQWRKIHKPPENNWWWYFESPARFWWLDRLKPLWLFLTWAVLAFSLTLILNTFTRIVEGGITSDSIYIVVIQIFLAFAGGLTTLTENGRKTLKNALSRLKIPEKLEPEISLSLATIFALAIWSINSFYLPYLATNLQQEGIKSYENGQYDKALSKYKLAIALSPDLIETHYHIGRLYDELQETDQAIAQYQLVVKNLVISSSDSPESSERLYLLRTLNNLGRLYTLKKQYRLAFSQLEKGLSLVDGKVATSNNDFAHVQYSLLKNLALVRIKQEYPLSAVPRLKKAIKLNSQRAAAHCLLAQAQEKIESLSVALPEWKKCKRYAALNEPDEAEWLGLANEKIAEANSLAENETNITSTND